LAVPGASLDGFPTAHTIGNWVLGLAGLLILAVLVDWWRTPPPESLAPARSVPERVGLSREFQRRLRLGAVPAGEEPNREAIGAGLLVEVREEFPASFAVVARTDELLARGTGSAEGGAGRGAAAQPASALPPLPGDPTGGPDRVFLAAHGPVIVTRTFRAERRGPQVLGDLRLRLRGPWGLLWRQTRIAAHQVIAVEPALSGLKRTLALAASERWHDLGVRRLRRRGGLTEFESLREYVRGDDVRLVDWKGFARHGRPLVREYQEERGQELIIAIDCGRRMGASTAPEGAAGGLGGWSKLDHALDAALELAAVALQGGDRVGIVAFDHRMRAFVPTGRGARQLAHLKEAVFDLLPSGSEADLERALREIAVRHPRRAMVILLTDVADPLSVPGQVRALAAASRRHRILFAALDDPSLRLAAQGKAQLELTPEQRVGLRATALAITAERRQGLREIARSGVPVINALPAESAAPVLSAWLDARRA
jgi:uncharacterized protein (DUF58 family)